MHFPRRVPASLAGDSYRMHHFKSEASTPAPTDTAPSVTPYLGLRARLSQIWLNRWTVLLILVLVRVLLLLGSLDDDLHSAKTKALSACTKVEDIGSAMASMPHYLSVGVNSLTATGITKAVHGMVQVMSVVITGVQELILFYINLMTSTYVCLIAALIHGGLDAAISAVEGVTQLMDKSLDGIADGISDEVGRVQKAINDFTDKIKGMVGVFGQEINPPTIDIGRRLDELRNVKVDSPSFVGRLIELNKTIPNFEDVQRLTRDAVSIPFNLIQENLNKSYSRWTFDESVFPVAEKRALSFCSGNSSINDFFDSLFALAAKAKIIFVVLLSVLAVLALVPMAWMEIRRWRKQQRLARLFSNHQYHPMDVIYISSRPMTATWGLKLASHFKGKTQLLVRWCVAYATTLPAIFVLSLALAGFFSCLCQFILLKSIEKEVPALAGHVGDFAGDVVNTLQDTSKQWSLDANGVITNFNDEINRDLLGYVTNGTTAVNNTLNTFVDEMNKVLDAAFKDTPLYGPVKDVVFCLVTVKLNGIERGLTWVHEQARVSFPLMPEDTFSLGAARSVQGDSELTSFLATPSSVTTDEVTGAVLKVVDRVRWGIVQEALISTALLLVYVIVVLAGVLRAALSSAMPGHTRGDGGTRFVVDSNETEADRTPSPSLPSRGEGSAPRDGDGNLGSVRAGRPGQASQEAARHSSHAQVFG